MCTLVGVFAGYIINSGVVLCCSFRYSLDPRSLTEPEIFCSGYSGWPALSGSPVFQGGPSACFVSSNCYEFLQFRKRKDVVALSSFTQIYYFGINVFCGK